MSHSDRELNQPLENSDQVLSLDSAGCKQGEIERPAVWFKDGLGEGLRVPGEPSEFAMSDTSVSVVDHGKQTDLMLSEVAP